MKNETALGHVLTLMTIIIWGTTFVSTTSFFFKTIISIFS